MIYHLLGLHDVGLSGYLCHEITTVKSTTRVRQGLFIGFFSMMLISCTNNRLDVDVSGVEAPVQFNRFGEAYFQNDSTEFPQLMGSLIEEHPFFFATGDSLIWVERRYDNQLNQLWSDVSKTFTESVRTQIETQVEDGMAHYAYHFSPLPNQTVYTYVSNLDFNYPVLYVDSLATAFIGLDLYLGPDHPAYRQLPDYLRRIHTPENIAPDLFEQYAFKYVDAPQVDQPLIDEMIRMGLVRYFQLAMLRNTAPEIVFGYTTQQWEFCEKNEINIWTYLVEKQLLFDSSLDTKRRFLFPAPFSKFYTALDNETPGRIGEWVGWKIVTSYMDNHPEVSISDLMNTSDFQSLFRESKYKPVR